MNSAAQKAISTRSHELGSVGYHPPTTSGNCGSGSAGEPTSGDENQRGPSGEIKKVQTRQKEALIDDFVKYVCGRGVVAEPQALDRSRDMTQRWIERVE